MLPSPAASSGAVTEPPLRVVICEPYATGSHRGWAEGLAAHSVHDVRLVTHAGGFWKWRMQGAALTLADELRALTVTWGKPDVLLVSDMVNVPALLGLARDVLDGVPVAVYFHENQLTYPTPEGEPVDHTYAMTNWLSMAAADRIVFNSEHHRREVLAALPRLLRRFPDHRHTGFLDEVAGRTCVLPVGIDVARFSLAAAAAGSRPVNDPPVVLWNHRWEYDKDPAAFFAALEAVAASGVDFGLIVAGTSYQTVPPEFERARRLFADRIVAFGTAPDDDYPALLRRADVVVSTAHHEFFGVAVAEAIAAGALPILPRRLSYPELVPAPGDPYLYDGDDPADLVARLCWALTDHAARRTAATAAHAHITRFAWPTVAPAYDAVLAALKPSPTAGVSRAR
jgi:glycosyltransferase involved in cell wall biosynthesis